MNHSGAIRRKSGVTVLDFLSSDRDGEARGPAEDGLADSEQAETEPPDDIEAEIPDTDTVALDPVPTPVPCAQRTPDETLMDTIGDFLTGNDLPITPANLVRAHAICSGKEPGFAALAKEMAVRGEPITQEWLDSVACEAAEQKEKDGAEVDALAASLQNSIEAFANSARDARTAATEHRVAMDEQAEEAERIDSTETAENLLARVTDLTRAIREQAQQAEEKMQRSEREAVSLRRDLEEAQRAANIDHLTGLPNRRALDAMLDGLWSEARDAGGDCAVEMRAEPVVLAFCDIDNFKPVNDKHGHDTGDRVLQMVARTLSDGAGEECQVVRYGGEEFLIVYRGLSLEDARVNLDAIRETLSKRPFVNRATREPLGTITFSGGIADLFAFSDHRAALRAADEALYRAKDNGRNRIELAVPPEH
ncbi:MAG: GGDEF domain-containing protein [Erythrobacter sp.]|nr:GGDEF domain-containing protein [Erythrobacter sp.]